MPLREFIDRAGVRWKVWDVQPEQLHPYIQALEVQQGFLEGWLVFETADGMERRRLYPIPVRWTEFDDARLDGLKASAEPVGARGEQVRRTKMERERATELNEERLPARPTHVEPREELMRSFIYPGGRLWTVTEHSVALRDSEGLPVDTRTVLHFTAGLRSLDLLAWPGNWASLTDGELAELLWLAFPRDVSVPNPTLPRRARRCRCARRAARPQAVAGS